MHTNIYERINRGRTITQRPGSRILLAFTLFTTLWIAFPSTSKASECPYRDSRICEIDKALQDYTGGHTVLYEEVGVGDIRSIAEAEWMIDQADIIRLSNSPAYGLTDLTFLIAHEFGHSFKKHSRVELETIAEPQDRGLSNRELFKKYGDPTDSPSELYHKQELEADTFAIEFMAHQKKSAYNAIRNVIASRSSSNTHPSKAVRLENAKRIIEKIQADSTSRPAN
jgi:hypothetical protein